MLQAHVPEEAGTGIEEAEQLVAAAEAVVVKQEVEGTEDAVVAAEVAIKREAARPGNADGKRTLRCDYLSYLHSYYASHSYSLVSYN